MPHRPKAIVLDVIETLFDTAPLEQKLHALGLPKGSLALWFPRVLRDAFALEVTGTYKDFREIATGTLQAFLAENQLEVDNEKIDRVLQAFATLPAHPDVEKGLAELRAAGFRVAALTNGSAETTRQMFQNAGFENAIEKIISIDDVQHWKPAAIVYQHAARELGLSVGEVALIAAHDWDIDGAAKAGLSTAYLARKQPLPSSAMRAPDLIASSLAEAARALHALPA